jgi:translocation and assembly module TamB
VSEPAAKPRRAWWKYLLITAGGMVVCALAGLWYLTTDSFQNLVRRRMVAEIERITGGHAEVGSFHTIPFRLQVDVRDITVRGGEASSDVPLAHADRLVARVKVISLLRTEFGFHEVILDHPVVHIAFYPGGQTNVPAPRVQRTSDQTPVEQLFALSINHLDVRHGELIWDDKNIPLDFVVHDSALQMDYALMRARYEGRLLLGKVDTRFDDYRPFAWMSVLEFSLGSTFADVKSLKFNSGRTHVDASGRISDFRHPQVQGNYDAVLDLGEASSIARRRDLREGVVELKGQGKWSLEEFATSGAVAVRDLGWQNEQIALNKGSLTADYSINDQQIKLSKLQGRLLGGSFAGDAQIDNWMNNTRVSPTSGGSRDDIAIITAARPQKAPPNKKAKAAEIQTGVVHLRLRDVSAEELAVALSAGAHALGRFRPVGFATGTLDARWRGIPRDADVAFALDVNPPLHSTAGQLPVTAKIQGTYRGGSDGLELSQLIVSTPASRLQASGTLSGSSALRFSATTSDLDELRPVIAVLHGPADIPFTVNGSATFNGVVGGTLTAPTLAGNLAAQDFDFTLPASERTPEQPVHWDSLSASIQISSRGLALRSGSLRHGETSAEFDITASLQKWQFADDSSLNARVNLQGVDVASTVRLAGYDYPVTGAADVFLQVAGTKSEPQIEGQIHATNASAYGESITQLDADLHAANGEAALANIHLIHDDSIVTGSAAYNPAAHTMRLDLEGRNFDLSRVRQIHSDRVGIEGRADFTLTGSGTLAAPVLDATIQVRDLTLDHELAGGLQLEAVTRNGELHVTGHSDFSHGSFQVDGKVQMRDDYPANISVRMDNLDIDALWRSYLQGKLTGHSAVTGTVVMQGPLRDPRRWSLDGDLSGMSLDVEYAKVHNQDPIRFHYAQQSLRIEQAHLVGEGTDLTTHGTVNFAGNRELDFSADGRIDLKLLNSIDPDVSASGMMSVNLTVGGTVAEPFPQGRIELTNGAVSYAGLPSGLSEMTGSLNFTRDRIHIDKLTARTGGGTLDLKGDATAYNHQLSFNLTATGKDVRLRYPPGVSSTADAELHWVGTRSSSTVSGDILVTKLAVTPNFDFSSYLERSRQISSITPANSPLYNVKLDVHVETAPELQMKTAVARLSGDADLRLRGSAARPVVLGRADILEGEATFNGTRFRLERGDITFANPVTIQPILNLEASTHVRNYDLAITVTGTPDQPGGLRVTYRSEPPLPQSDIIALLALGRTSEESEQLQQQSGQTAFTDEATALIINQAISSTVTSRMQKLFGVSRIKIDPQGLTTETNPTARGPQVTIEQQFANNISLSYSTNVSQSAQQIIEGEYYFTRNVSVVGNRDQNGVVSFDVRIRRQKK